MHKEGGCVKRRTDLCLIVPGGAVASPPALSALFQTELFSIIMGKQHNKEIKRQRRKALTKRRKEAVKVAKANPAAAKSAAVARREAAPKKKSAPRKAAPAKKAEPGAAAEE
jgi:peptidoglycan hydrolase CwlO-like protein